ncbi:hypothetical protein BCR36DRAFT_372582 [Piromyces finnis]|uniref:Right handed beta helix domain-containing protein n=1 Tax=Piromyces finnis TaxID=1754191 RepID=A0A1Y1V3H6_9FUNG|nr:hypothetical protein BCR36DRAFT_372582 [Piromyces finnis]|eukprot:ORX45797.1 hypothetical protein BCR36DRAFT_372582 [Piromyces finnis]
MIQINYFILILLLASVIILKKCSAIDVYIPNEKYDIANINDLIQHYSLLDKTIKIHITKNYIYSSDMIAQQIHIPENTNITLIGSSSLGTTFDFSNKRNNVNNFFLIFGDNEYFWQQFIIENITFKNFYTYSLQQSLFYISNYKINYKVIFKHCSFVNSDSLILIVDSQNSINKNQLDSHVLFDSCRFKKIKGNGVILLHGKKINNYGIKIIDSEFTSCNNIAKLYFGNIEFDYCKLTNISSSVNSAHFVEMLNDSSLMIKNTVIYNNNNNNNDSIELQKMIPFIRNNGNLMTFHNVTLRNIQNSLGYLINDIGQIRSNSSIYINNSYFESNYRVYNIINRNLY